MATEVDVIRTVFEAQFRGQNAIQNFRRELDLVGKASNAIFGSRGVMKEVGQGAAAFDNALNARNIKIFNERVQALATHYKTLGFTTGQARSIVETWSDELAKDVAVTEKAATATGVLGTSLSAATVAAGAAAAAIVGVGVALHKLYPIAQEGAGLEQLSLSFNRLNQNVLHTPGLVNDMRDAAKGTISSFDAMAGFMTLTAGASEENARAFAAAAPELMEVAKAANVLNPLLGDTNFMFQSLSRGIKRNETRLIDNLGLNVKMAEANRAYAAQIGKTVQQLTAEDKQIATLNETLRVGRLLIAQLNGDTASLADTYLRLGAAAEEAKGQLKISIAQMYPAGGIEGLAALLENLAVLYEKKNVWQRASISGDFTEAQMQGIWAQSLAMSADELREYVALVEKYNRVEEARKERDYRSSLLAPGRTSSYYNLDRSMLMQWARWEPTPGAGLGVGEMGTSFGDQEYWDNYQNTLAQARREVAQKNREAAKEEEAWQRQELQRILQHYIEIDKGIIESGEELTRAVAEHNAMVAAAYQERVAETGAAMQQAMGDDSGLYTTAIKNIGDAWVTVGGRTKEQQDRLDGLIKDQERAKEVLWEYEAGIRGIGQKEDARNKKIAEQTQLIKVLGTEIENLNSIQGEAQKVHQSAIWDQEKLNQLLLDQAMAGGVGAIGYAQMMRELGMWNDEQADAAIRAAAVIDATKQMQDELRNVVTPEDARRVKENFDKMVADIGQVEVEVLFKTPVQRQRAQLAEFDEVGVVGLLPSELTPEERDYYQEIRAEAEKAGGDAATSIREQLFDTLPEEHVMEVSWEQGAIQAMIQELDRLPKTWYIDVVPVPPDYGGGGGGPGLPREERGRAIGGPVSRNTAYIVGERGPELFWPWTNGTIDPNIGGGGGSRVVNNHYYNSEAAAIGMALEEYFERMVN